MTPRDQYGAGITTTLVYCRCDRCRTPSPVPTGLEIPRHWVRTWTARRCARDLCPDCQRADREQRFNAGSR